MHVGVAFDQGVQCLYLLATLTGYKEWSSEVKCLVYYHTTGICQATSVFLKLFFGKDLSVRCTFYPLSLIGLQANDNRVTVPFGVIGPQYSWQGLTSPHGPDQ